MKEPAQNPKVDAESKGSTLNELLKRSSSKREEEPAEEFITPDPTRSVPDKNVGVDTVDKMGISEKAKNQPSDEKDISENKK